MLYGMVRVVLRENDECGWKKGVYPSLFINLRIISTTHSQIAPQNLLQRLLDYKGLIVVFNFYPTTKLYFLNNYHN